MTKFPLSPGNRNLLTAITLAAVLLLPLTCCWAIQKSDPASPGGLDEMELIGRVNDLQRQLASERIPEREEAAAELLKLGPIALDHLDDPTGETTSDVRERLASIRKQLETILVRNIAEPSEIAVVAGWTLDQTLEQLRSQTGNDVTLSGNLPMEVGQTALKLTAGKMKFWNLLQQILQQGKLSIDPYAGNGNKLVLVQQSAAGNSKTSPTIPRSQNGVFEFSVTRIDASRNLVTPQHNVVNLGLRIRWEPRVRPISIRIPAKSIVIIDEFDQPVVVVNPKEVFSAIVQPEIPMLDFTLPIELVDRQIETLKSVTATAEAILPGRLETFRFRNAGRTAPGTKQEKAGAVVTLERIEMNEDLYGITVSLAFEEEFNALESHQSWAFDNPLWLEDEQGQRLDPIAFETVRQDNSGIAVTYLFPDEPTNQTLIYQTPAAIVQSSIEINLKSIPLP